VLTDNGMAFAEQPMYRGGMTDRYGCSHIFGRVCRKHGIAHKLTKPYQPWTNGQAERMNRTVKEATLKAFHHSDLEALKTHVLGFVTAHTFAKHLKALRWRTSLQAVCEAWHKEPSRFEVNPHHLTPRPNTSVRRESPADWSAGDALTFHSSRPSS
jgi:transposase InsO family protein